MGCIELALIGALGEELGWRSYLQPRLQAAGVSGAGLWVGLLWWTFHLPAVLLLGYPESSMPLATQALFAVSCVADSYFWIWACTREGSVWPAAWFHTFHNISGQGLFPSLMKDPVIWIGEDGVLPVGGHLLAAAALWAWARRARPPPTPATTTRSA
jgi:membrane protease YdiL (CAAX protease family)